jgi:hypothetical protein
MMRSADFRLAVASARAWRVVALTATLAAGALCAVVFAYWAWQIFGPARAHIAPAAPADPVAALLASGLFSTPAGTPAPAPEAAPRVLAGDVRLLGVFAEARERGYALFRLPSGPKLVAAGQEIAPGATLTAVRPDGISVREAAGERSIALRALPVKATSVAAPVAGKIAASQTACAPPAGFKGQVVALNAELMGGLIAQPESWRALVDTGDGALVVRDDSGFAAMLGLKRGDRVEQANGIPLTAADDIVGAVLRPLASNQPVRVLGSRDGKPRELWLQNAGCRNAR